MADLSYGSVQLSLMKMNVFSRESIYTEDGTGYLWTKITIDGIFAFNPGVNSYRFGNTPVDASGDGPPPLETASPATLGAFTASASLSGQPTSPVLTSRALHHWLMTPRRQLVFRFPQTLYSLADVGTDEELQTALGFYEVAAYSPLTDPTGDSTYEADAKGGPFPVACDVQEADANVLWTVRYVIETYITECVVNEADTNNIFTPSVKGRNSRPWIIANRWQMTSGQDEDGTETITVSGRATFRRDVLRFLGQKQGITLRSLPDTYRSSLMLPVLRGFKRGAIVSRPSSDGTALEYEYVDKQQLINFPNRRRATRIKATFLQDLSQPNDVSLEGLSFAGDAARYAEDTVADIGLATAALGLAAIPIVGSALAAVALGLVAVNRHVASRAIGAAGRTASFAANIFPRWQGVAEVTVWGAKKSTKFDLYKLALAVAFGQFPGVDAFFTAAGTFPNPFRLTTQWGLYDKTVYVRLERSFSFTPFGMFGLAGGMGSILAGPVNEEVVGGKYFLPVLGTGGVAGLIAALTALAGPAGVAFAAALAALKADPKFSAALAALGIGQQILPDTGELLGTQYLTPPNGATLNPMPASDYVGFGDRFSPATISPPEVPSCVSPQSLGEDILNGTFTDIYLDPAGLPGTPLTVPGVAWRYDGRGATDPLPPGSQPTYDGSTPLRVPAGGVMAPKLDYLLDYEI